MTMLKARPTVYNGIQMRSRLEAAFAATLDASGAGWEYEPRAYANEGGQYLPDFQLLGRDRPTFVEVKPTPDAAEATLGRMEIILASEPAAVLEVAIPYGYYGGDDTLWDWLTRYDDGAWHWSFAVPVRPAVVDWPPVEVVPTRTTESLRQIMPRFYGLLEQWYAAAHEKSA